MPKKGFTSNTKLREISFNKILPNLVTSIALCVGLSGIKFALEGRWEAAVFCVIIAAILDGMDGRLARLLGGASRFGAELDSLADACSFGLTPGLIVYFYALTSIKPYGWALCLFYILCMIFRLARFNSFLNNEENPLPSKFFQGIPAPAGGLLVLFPLMLSFVLNDIVIPHAFYGFYLFIVSLLLISKIPTFSFKKGSIPKPFAWLLFVFVGVLGAMMVTEPWLTMIILCIVYLLTLPFSIVSYKRYKASLNVGK